MPRISVLAIAAVAALSFSALAMSEASARFGGGGGGGMSRAGGHVGGVTRAVYHPGNSLAVRRSGNINRPGNGLKLTHVPRLPHPPKIHRHHRPHWVWHWCRHHHHHHWCHNWGIGVIDPVFVADAPAYVMPAAAVCTSDCDYLLNDGTGCYMAKRKFSTPQGDDLRCVKICDEPPLEVK